MRLRLLPLVLLLVIGGILGSSLVSGGSTPPAVDDLAQANRFFAEHNYSKALELYATVRADLDRPLDDRGHAFLRSARCLRRLKRWDESIALLAKPDPAFQSGIWTARSQALRGTISLTMPHWYYKKGEQISRENWIQGATYHYTYYDDLIAALKDLDSAARLYEPFVSTPLSSDLAERRVREFVKICIEMATAIESHRSQKGGLIAFEPHPDVRKDYVTHDLGRYLALAPRLWYARAEEVALRQGRRDGAALARYSLAMYTQRLLSSLAKHDSDWVDGTCKVRVRQGGTREQPNLIALPEILNPFSYFREFLKDYAKSALADDATFGYAKICHDHGHFTRSLALMKDFSSKFPRSPWKNDVLALEQEIRHPQLALQNPPSRRPGEKTEVSINLRNVPEIRVEAYPIDLEDLFTSRRYLRDDEGNLASLQRNLRQVSRSQLRRIGAVVDKKIKTPDRGEFDFHEMKVTLDLPSAGAYLIEASHEGIAYRTLAVVSEIAMLRKFSNEKTLVYVGEAGSGKPVVGATVLVKQRHRARGIFGRYQKVSYREGQSGDDGLFLRSHDLTSLNGSNVYLEAFAAQGDHYALTTMNWADVKNEKASGVVVYGFTDRPVYRPLDTINFVGNLRKRDDQAYLNLPDEDVTVRIIDPKGNKIFERVMTTDSDGAVDSQVVLGEEPPLGNYRIEYRLARRRIGQTRFQVEEYKKPEYEVIVSGPDEAQRLGGKVKAKIHGEYYFGGGVADAKVNYRVFRVSYAPSFRYADPYRYLYGDRRPAPRGGQRELVYQGEGRSDAAGDLEIEIDSAPWASKYPDQDHVFVVEADMTDLSRRTISGSGQFVVARKGLFLSLKAPRGFYRAGERVEVEIQCQDADGKPMPSRGQVVVYRVTSTGEGDDLVESRNQVDGGEAATDAKGMGFFNWQTDAPGRFAVTYVTQDRWGEVVVGELQFWVHGPDYKAEDFQFKNLELVTDKREYRPGETAYVLINHRFADSTLFLTLEAESRILSHQVLRTNGKTKVLALPIEEGYAPNVFLHVMSIREGGFFQATREIFVPPTQRFMDVSARFEQDSYLPGQKAKLVVDSRDHKGNPVSARFAASIYDKSITYIRSDSTPDIRRFFYGARRSFRGGQGWRSNQANSLQFTFRGYQLLEPSKKTYRSRGMPPGWWHDEKLGDGFLGNYDSFSRSSDQWDAAPEEELEEELAEASPAPSAEASGGLASNMDMRSLGRVSESKRARAPSSKKRKALAFDADGGSDAEEAATAAPALRQNFSDLAAWSALLRTDDQGRAELELKFPDSLTTWIASLRGMTKDSVVGEARTETRTQKSVQVRMQAPRFFTERDEVVISGIVRNEFDEAIDVRTQLEIPGDGPLRCLDALERRLELGPKSEIRVDWTVRVVHSGEARLTMRALSQRESDAVAMRFPVLAYGIDKVVTQLTHIDGDGRREIPISLPLAKDRGDARLEVSLAPSIASSLLEALPYLIDYPYGCTEQTMSRFLPAVVVSKTLSEMGTSLDEIKKRRQELENRDKLAMLSPVRGDAQLQRIVALGRRRLESMQNSDGGFGWWKADRSSVRISAYVLWGFSLAKEAGYSVSDSLMSRCAAYLEKEAPEITDANDAAFVGLALSAAGKNPGELLARLMKGAGRAELLRQGSACAGPRSQR